MGRPLKSHYICERCSQVAGHGHYCRECSELYDKLIARALEVGWLTRREIAEEFGFTEDAVYARLARKRKRQCITTMDSLP